MSNLKIEYVKLSDLKAYDKNARMHSEQQILQVMNSISEFGFTNPVLIDDNNVLIAGHGRSMAAERLGMFEVPAIRLVGLSEDKRKALRIADNQIALNSTWDMDLLAQEIQDLQLADYDIDILGFSDEEIDSLLNGLSDDEDSAGLTDDDQVPEPPEDPVAKRGDVWICGNHRLMCGDSTMIDDVAKLMAGKVVNFGFCDPPYNLGFEYNSYDDNKSDEEYRQFSKLWFSNLKLHSDRQAVTLGTKNIPIMANLDVVAGVGCWVKKNWITSCHIAKLQQWEPIFFYGDYTKFKRSSDLYEINRKIQKDVGDSHSCPKQIELIVDIVENYTNKNDSVMDLFGGSGTTMIAAEKTKRASYLMEFDPVYCDVIIKRWQEYTGQEAMLQSTKETFNILLAK